MTRPSITPSVGGRAPRWLVRSLRAIEHEPRLDPLADVLARATDTVMSHRAREALRGRWLGHALHPLLTDIPIGAWTAANILDLVGRRRSRPAATGFMALGLVSAVPTVATGLAEWRDAGTPARRVGAVHATLNLVAVAAYVASLAQRLRRRHTSAVMFGLVGTTIATGAGYLGGHLATAHRMGTVDPDLTNAH